MPSTNPYRRNVERSRLVKIARQQAKAYVARTAAYFESLIYPEDEEVEKLVDLLDVALDSATSLSATLDDLADPWIGMCRESRRIVRAVDRRVAGKFPGEDGVPTFAGMLAEARDRQDTGYSSFEPSESDLLQSAQLNSFPYWTEPVPDLLERLEIEEDRNTPGKPSTSDEADPLFDDRAC